MTFPTSIPEYNKFRLNTLSVDNADRVFLVIDCPADLRPLIVGQISELFDPNLWRDYGVMTPDAMAELVNNEVLFVDICDAVADCIATSSEIQQTINEIINANTDVDKTTTNITNVTIISGAVDDDDCTNDAKFGRIVKFIDYIDEVQLDFYQSIDAALNVLSQVDELISAVPILETLPVDELVGFVGDTGELWRDSYEASLNTQLKEDFACELWCLYKDKCEISVKDVLDAVLARYNLDTTQGQLSALSLALLLGRVASTVGSAGGLTYIGDDFVYLSWLLQLAAVELTSSFFGVDLIDYVNQAAQGPDDSNWTLCGCSSAALNITFDGSGDPFTISSGVIDNGLGNPAPSAAASSGAPCGASIFAGDLRLTINSDQAADITVNRVEFDLRYECVISGTQRPRWRVRLFDASNNLIEDSGFGLPNINDNQKWNRITWFPSTPRSGVRRVEVQAAKFDAGTFNRQRQTYNIDNIQVF